VNVQAMVFNPVGVEGEGEEIAFVNPVVYKSSKQLLVFEDGCLSFPGIYADVLVRMEATNHDFRFSLLYSYLFGLLLPFCPILFGFLLSFLFFSF
jgi:peptide deformylase